MLKEITKTKESSSDAWLENIEADLPEEITDGQNHGKLPHELRNKKIQLKIHDLTSGKEINFRAGLEDTLGEVFAKAAESFGKPLLPPSPQVPLDILSYRTHGAQWSEPITNLEQPLWLALAKGYSRHFGIEFKLVVKINTQWNVAPAEKTTPRQLLTTFGMDAQKFSLYRLDGTEPLPSDTPLEIKRGEMFEAQADGRYGSSIAPAQTKPRGSQTIQEDVKAVEEAGVNARLLIVGGQKYIELRDLKVPSPPWSNGLASILIAVPFTYPMGGLDAFYLELPFNHANGSIPYQQQIINLDGRNWALISWHYHNNSLWNPSHDDLASHIEHCRGFFLTRGVKQ